MWKDDGWNPMHAWGSSAYVNEERKNSADTAGIKAFNIAYDNIPKEACIELIIQDQNNAQVKLIMVYDYGLGEAYAIPPVRLDDAIKICKVPSIDEIYFFFEIDISDSQWKNHIDE